MIRDSVLVTLATKSYLDQARQLFSSAFFNGGWDGDFLLLAFDIKEDELVWFKDRGIFIHNVIPFDNSLQFKIKVLLSTLEIFKIKFKRWKRVVFLDSDMIVRYSILGLKEAKGLGGVNGIAFKKLSDRFRKLNFKLILKGHLMKWIKFRLRFDISGPGINGGLYSFDTSLINENTYNEMITIYNEYKDLFLMKDEAVVALYFKNYLNLLPLYYNTFVKHYGMDQTEKSKGIILHFVGTDLPWSKKSPYYYEWKASLDKANLMKKDLINETFPELSLNEMEQLQKILYSKFRSYKIGRKR